MSHASRAAVHARAAAAAWLAVALALAGCIGGVKPSECAVDADCGSAGAPGFCVEGGCHPGSGPLCPRLTASFASIDRDLFKVGCGAGGSANACHNAAGSAAGSGIDFSRPAHEVYLQLYRVPQVNMGPQASGPLLLRVDPGHPDSSFLAITLKTTSNTDPVVGSGQPESAPGQLCAAAQLAISDWIAAGALEN